jgi:hypothetical protein
MSEMLVKRFGDVIFELDLANNVFWDAIIVPVPAGPPQSNGQPSPMEPVGWFVMEMPGAILNSRLRVSLLMQNPALIDRDAALSIVRQAVEALERQRSEELTKGNTVTPEVAGLHGAVLL